VLVLLLLFTRPGLGAGVANFLKSASGPGDRKLAF